MPRRIGQIVSGLGIVTPKGMCLVQCVKRMSSLARFRDLHQLVRMCHGAAGIVGSRTWRGVWCQCRCANT